MQCNRESSGYWTRTGGRRSRRGRASGLAGGHGTTEDAGRVSVVERVVGSAFEAADSVAEPNGAAIPDDGRKVGGGAAPEQLKQLCLAQAAQNPRSHSTGRRQRED